MSELAKERWRAVGASVITIENETDDIVAVVRSLGGANDYGERARLIAAAPELLSTGKRLIHIAKVIGDKQHAGNPISLNLWSELYTAENESRAAIAKATGK